jgi:release factor glutamine methyltransferase
MSTVAQQLQQAREILAPVSGELAALEARILAQHAWHVQPEVLVRDANSAVDHEKIAAFETLIARRMTREPIAQIMGYKHFWKDNFQVTRDVLTPRADSETLIEAALRNRPKTAAPKRILDLGTGSGCLLLSLLGEYPDAFGTGVDASAAALNVARRNAHNTFRAERCEFLGGSWCDSIEISARFDMVVSNPPYIPTREISRLMSDVRDHEPHGALDGGTDGLDCYRAILASVMPHMNPGAILLFEVGMGQADDVAMHAKAHGFSLVEIVADLSGIDRVVVLETPKD